MKDTDLAWLGGIWDGEGSIALFTHTEKTGNQKICPSVSVVNTDIHIINKVRKILEELECSFVLQERAPKNSRHKQQYILTSRNTKYIIKFLESMIPFIFSDKRPKAEILLDYCKRRSEKMERLPSKGSTPYSEEDWDTLAKFKAVNKVTSNNSRSSQTTREALVQE